MKFAILTTSAVILSATLVSGDAFAQRQTVTIFGQGDSYTCHYQNNYLFSCENREVFYVPPVRDPYPPAFVRKNRLGGNEGGGGGGGNFGGGGGNAGSTGGSYN